MPVRLIVWSVAVFSRIAAGLGIGVGLVLPVMVTVRFCDSPWPAVIPVRFTVCAVAEFSRIAGGLGIAASVGTWLTGRTFTVNDWEKVLLPPVEMSPSSMTV